MLPSSRATAEPTTPQPSSATRTGVTSGLAVGRGMGVLSRRGGAPEICRRPPDERPTVRHPGVATCRLVPARPRVRPRPRAPRAALWSASTASRRRRPGRASDCPRPDARVRRHARAASDVSRSADVEGEQVVLGLAAQQHPHDAVPDRDHRRAGHVVVLARHAAAVGPRAGHGEQVAGRDVAGQELVLARRCPRSRSACPRPGPAPAVRPRTARRACTSSPRRRARCGCCRSSRRRPRRRSGSGRGRARPP